MRIPLGALILTVALTVTMTLGGCASNGLRQLDAPRTGPDEFLILPSKPLTAPQDFDVLPTPTPGGTNLTDRNPMADAVVALGGRASALEYNGVPASDAALVAQASRFGVPADIRASLAEADAQFRKRQAWLTNIRLFPVDRYEQAYRRQALDPFAEAARFRGAGIGTPSSPPPNE